MTTTQEEMGFAMADAMIKAFGDRAAEVAQNQISLDAGDTGASWAFILKAIESRAHASG